MRKSTLPICFLALFMSVIYAVPAFAAVYHMVYPEYVYTDLPNTTVEQPFITWGAQRTHHLTLVRMEVRTLIQAGDNVSINWYTRDEAVFDSTTVSGSSATITPPPGAYGAKLVMTSGDAPGDRWAWWHSGSNSGGSTSIFPDPDTSGSSDPAPDPGSSTDLRPVVNDLAIIQDQLEVLDSHVVTKFNAVLDRLTTIQGQLDTLNSSVVTKFDEVLDQLTVIQGQLTTVQDQLTTVQGQLTTIQGQLDTIDSHVVDIYEYFSTPRTSAPMTVEMPHLTVDPTPPPVEEPYQEPYTYNRPTQQYELPPMVDSPGPLPWAPEPTIMPHDPPAEIGPPKEIEQPRQRDPVQVEPPRVQDPSNREEPRAVSPVGRDTPLAPTPVSMDPPHAQDPPNREAPRTQAPPSREEPRTVSPVGRDTPLAPAPATNREQPITPAPPLTPEPPR